ncbi:MAG: hypothetical protein GHHEDOFH_03000 [Pseudorhodoplanes sp.]|nr:hypothetical protein [Pseudorhodoplanes sp.]
MTPARTLSMPLSMPFALILAAGLTIGATPAAAQPLAVGEVIPLTPPPGWAYRAVYTEPAMHSRWTPTDTSSGKTFREPLYVAPPGYVYRHVRGYQLVRLPDPVARPVVRKPSVKKARRTANPRCVTDLGYGRIDFCD